ncbi:MAG: hypothetical protein ABIR81_06890 [Ginsengibacter sp.]
MENLIAFFMHYETEDPVNFIAELGVQPTLSTSLRLPEQQH